MKNVTITQLLELIQQLTPEQKQCIKGLLDQDGHLKDEPKSLFDRIEENFCSHPHCPHCNSKSNNKWGKQDNKQRFKCLNCKKNIHFFYQY